MKPPHAPRPRRRFKRSLAARLGRFWVLGVLIAGALVWGGWAIAALPAFRLHELAVTGAHRVSRAEVVARAAIDPAGNVWLVDRAAVEKRIDGIPYVLAAHVHRRPPGTVWIEIEERTPSACVHDGAGHEYLVDDALRVLADVCTTEVYLTYDIKAAVDASAGEFLRDPELLALQNDARALADDGNRYRSFAHDAFGQLEATLHDGIAVRFGDEDDLDRKQRLIGPILAQLGSRADDVRTLDVRAPATPVVEYRH